MVVDGCIQFDQNPLRKYETAMREQYVMKKIKNLPNDFKNYATILACKMVPSLTMICSEMQMIHSVYANEQTKSKSKTGIQIYIQSTRPTKVKTIKLTN